MTTKYLVACACGRKWPVQSSQAGEHVACTCGAQVDVPTLRGLTALPVVAEQRQATRGWTKTHGICFLGSIAWGVVGAAITWWLWSRAARPVELPMFDQKSEEYSSRVDELTPADSLTYWRMFRDAPDKMLTSPQRVAAAANQNARTVTLAWVAGAVSLIGVVGFLLAIPLTRGRRANSS